MVLCTNFQKEKKFRRHPGMKKVTFYWIGVQEYLERTKIRSYASLNCKCTYCALIDSHHHAGFAVTLKMAIHAVILNRIKTQYVIPVLQKIMQFAWF